MSQDLKCCDSQAAVCGETASLPAAETEFVPNVDIVETDDAVLLTAEMPGVDESSADVTLEKNILTIRGVAKPDAMDGYSLIYSEYETGSFVREFTVSAEIDRAGMQATMKNGVLRVKLPKAKQAVSQKIAITAG